MKKPLPSPVPALSAVALAGLALYAGIALRRRLSASDPSTAPRKVVLVTGGSRGLGFAIARRYARSGTRLALTARNPAQLAAAREQLLALYPGHAAEDILILPADLTDPTQAAGVVRDAIAYFGHLDILVNNAGIITVGPVDNQSLATYVDAMQTNFFAALYTIDAALPHLLGRAATGHTPAIVNISSVGGKVAVPHMLPYTASKFALAGFSEGLHAELRGRGVRVTTVCPGLMRSGGEAHAQFTGNLAKEQRWFNLAAKTPILATSATHAANQIFHAVAAGRAEITITPQAWLAARLAGLAPETTQRAASFANDYLLPAPAEPRWQAAILTRPR
jgi:short-subunit dehydrogenase